MSTVVKMKKKGIKTWKKHLKAMVNEILNDITQMILLTLISKQGAVSCIFDTVLEYTAKVSLLAKMFG